MGARCWLIIHFLYTAVLFWTLSLPLHLCCISHTISFIACLSAVHIAETHTVADWLISFYRWMRSKMVFSVSPHSSLPRPPPPVLSGFSALLVLTWAINRLISYSRTLAYWTEQMNGGVCVCLCVEWFCVWRGRTELKKSCRSTQSYNQELKQSERGKKFKGWNCIADCSSNSFLFPIFIPFIYNFRFYSWASLAQKNILQIHKMYLIHHQAKISWTTVIIHYTKAIIYYL